MNVRSADPIYFPRPNKHGFEVLKEVQLGKDGPPMWTMLRQPVR